MKINDLEKMLGISRANIRFYEKEGLLSPVRKENGYRSYSEDDASLLRKVIVLRKLGVSIQDIKALLNGSTSMELVMDSSIERIQHELTDLQGALHVCEDIRSRDLDIDSMDGEELLAEINAGESRGLRFSDLAKDILTFEINTMVTGKIEPDEDSGIKHTLWKRIVLLVCPLLIAIVICGIYGSRVSGDFFAGIRYSLKFLAVYLCIYAAGLLITYFIAKKNKKAARIFLWITLYGSIIIWNIYQLIRLWSESI